MYNCVGYKEVLHQAPSQSALKIDTPKALRYYETAVLTSTRGKKLIWSSNDKRLMTMWPKILFSSLFIETKE